MSSARSTISYSLLPEGCTGSTDLVYSMDVKAMTFMPIFLASKARSTTFTVRPDTEDTNSRSPGRISLNLSAYAAMPQVEVSRSLLSLGRPSFSTFMFQEKCL